MIKRSGEDIAPELEVLLTEHPAISEAVVFGVPDPIRTEEVAVVAASAAGLSAAEVCAFVGDRMAAWKAPRYVVVLPDDLPKLPSGKIDRQAVERSFSAGEAWDALAVSATGRP